MSDAKCILTWPGRGYYEAPLARVARYEALSEEVRLELWSQHHPGDWKFALLDKIGQAIALADLDPNEDLITRLEADHAR